MNPSRLNGKKIVGSDGNILGEVEGVDVDLDSWRATTLHVSLTEDAAAGFGLRKPLLSKIIVCFPTQIVDSVGDVLTLKVALFNLDSVAKECLSNPTQLKGKTVLGARGFVVGAVEALDLEPSSWQVTGLLVGLTGEAAAQLDLSRSFLSRVVVTVPVKMVSSVGNMVTLNETIEDLKALAKTLERS